jgi:hypothetical protein
MLKHILVIATAGLLATTACSKKGGASDPAINNDADYESKVTAFMDKYIAVLAADGTDCGKLAKDINALIDDNKALMDNIDAYEKAHPEASKALDTKLEAKFKEEQDKLAPVRAACKESKELHAATSRMK